MQTIDDHYDATTVRWSCRLAIVIDVEGEELVAGRPREQNSTIFIQPCVFPVPDVMLHACTVDRSQHAESCVPTAGATAAYQETLNVTQCRQSEQCFRHSLKRRNNLIQLHIRPLIRYCNTTSAD